MIVKGLILDNHLVLSWRHQVGFERFDIDIYTGILVNCILKEEMKQWHK